MSLSYNVTVTPDHDKTSVRRFTNTSSEVNVYDLEMGVRYDISIYAVDNEGQRSTATNAFVVLRKSATYTAVTKSIFYN